MKIITTLKLKFFNGEFNNLDEFDSKFLQMFDILKECHFDSRVIRFMTEDNYLKYLRNEPHVNNFAIDTRNKTFWYGQDFLFNKILGHNIDNNLLSNGYLNNELSDGINSRISLFFNKYLNLNDLKMFEFNS